jgi:hypothetical protein
METRHAARGDRLAVAALVGYSLVLAFLIGPAIRGAFATGAEPVPDLAAAPAAVGAEAAGQAVGGPPAAPGVAVAVEATADPVADPADMQVVPQLSGNDEVRAQALVKADKRLRKIVGATPYTVEKIGPWTTSNGPWTEKKKTELIGASLVLSFAGPIEISDKLMPGALYDVTERRSPPYQEVDLQVDASGVTSLMVLVDLKRGKVVNVSPGLGSVVTRADTPAGFRREVPDLSNEYPNPAEAPKGGEQG